MNRDHRQGSNPATPTKKTVKEPFFDGFYKQVHEVCQQSVPMQYRLPVIRHHDYNLKKRWYVEFYAWDVSKDILVRKRLFEPINRKKTVGERLRIAESICSVVRRQLLDGKVLGKHKRATVTSNIIRMSLLEAIDFFIEQKQLSNNRTTYVRNFTTLKNVLTEWMQFSDIEDFPVKQFSSNHAFDFFSYLQVERKVANKTFNNTRGNLTTVLKFLQRKAGELFKVFPMEAIDRLPVHTKRNAAFSSAQIQAIVKEAKKLRYKKYILFTQFMYYTLGRPKELTALRISDIDLDQKQILFRAEISKNRRDEYVGIPPALQEIILQSHIPAAAPTDFVFALEGRPLGINYMYKRNKKILDTLKFNDRGYSLYSFKHSGAVSLYQATKDIKLVQRQCRHTTINQTNEYLRDLNLLSDYDQLNEWNGAFG